MCNLFLSVTLATLAPAASNDIVTSFEGIVGTGFSLGDFPLSADFLVRSDVPVDPALARTGSHALLVSDSENVGFITFIQPGQAVEFWFRDSNPSVNSVVTVFDTQNNVLKAVSGDHAQWTQVQVSAGAFPIGRIRIQNPGPIGDVALDDLTYCAVPLPPPIGTSYCGPAAPNNMGLPGIMAVYGSTDVADNDVLLVASQLSRTTFAFFLTSETQGFVPNPPGAHGNLCLGGKIGRYQKDVFFTGYGGGGMLQIDLTSMPMSPFQAVQPGETWNFTAWYRDVNNPPGSSNFTDAVSVQFQ